MRVQDSDEIIADVKLVETLYSDMLMKIVILTRVWLSDLVELYSEYSEEEVIFNVLALK